MADSCTHIRMYTHTTHTYALAHKSSPICITVSCLWHLVVSGLLRAFPPCPPSSSAGEVPVLTMVGTRFFMKGGPPLREGRCEWGRIIMADTTFCSLRHGAAAAGPMAVCTHRAPRADSKWRPRAPGARRCCFSHGQRTRQSESRGREYAAALLSLNMCILHSYAKPLLEGKQTAMTCYNYVHSKDISS